MCMLLLALCHCPLPQQCSSLAPFDLLNEPLQPLVDALACVCARRLNPASQGLWYGTQGYRAKCLLMCALQCYALLSTLTGRACVLAVWPHPGGLTPPCLTMRHLDPAYMR